MNEIGREGFLTPHPLVRTWYRYALLLVLAMLFALDIVTTTISLQQGHFERNPFMIPFVENPLLHGIIKIGAFACLVMVIETAVVFIQERQPENKPFWIHVSYQTLYSVIIFSLLYLIWLYFFVIINNIQIIM